MGPEWGVRVGQRHQVFNAIQQLAPTLPGRFPKPAQTKARQEFVRAALQVHKARQRPGGGGDNLITR
eukprot:9430043-Lingulodinium_polyedra.AAC.1